MFALFAMPAPRWGEAAVAELRALPRLNALDALLRRGRRQPPSRDWRAGVQGALGAGAERIAPVAVAASAVPAVPRDAGVCFASPLHLIAGISRVHLPPAGALQLEAAEAEAWRLAFNRELGGADVQLHATTTGTHWLLEAACADAARDVEPDALAGAALERQAASFPGERALRRLSAEVEMWLAAHPLNQAREAKGKLALNALWFWGGARAIGLPPLRSAMWVASDVAHDAWLTGLTTQLHCPSIEAGSWDEACHIAGQLSTGTSAPREHAPALALVVMKADAANGSVHYWQMLEQHWFEPLSRAMDQGALSGLRLQVGGACWQVPRRGAFHWLRRRRHWAELIAHADA